MAKRDAGVFAALRLFFLVFFVGETEFGQGRLTGKFEPALVVNKQKLDGNEVAEFAYSVNALDIAVAQLADVAKALETRDELDKRAEFLDGNDFGILIKGAYLGGLGHRLNHCLCLEVAVAADAADEDGAVFLDFDCGIGLFLEGLDVLAARADDFADKFGVYFNGNKFRRVNAKLWSFSVLPTQPAPFY